MNQSRLTRYVELLLKWNSVFNLTAHKNAQEIEQLDIADSLSILPFLKGDRILDIGSGAGFPGIPLAITCPDKQFVLLDSNGKKTRFLVQAVADLGLNNVNVQQSRIEKYSDEQGFDHIVSRAFSDLKLFVSLSEHLIKPTGSWLAMKGVYPDVELQGLSQDAKVQAISVPGLDAKRHVVMIYPGTDCG